MILRTISAYFLLTALFAYSPKAYAQTDAAEKKADNLELNKPKKFYMGNGLDGAIFSMATLKKGTSDPIFTPVRFTYILNFGVNFNYDISNVFGLFTGAGIKNIGFIENVGPITTKRRVYTIGVPIGLKIGNLSKRNFGFIGGGVDVPFNYREKSFKDRNDKTKFNEWFSDRTPLVMPYVFVGGSVKPGITYKFQYYPSNFFNTSFSQSSGTTITYPYAAYDVHLLMLCVGFDIHYKRWPKPVYVDKDDDESDQ